MMSGMTMIFLTVMFFPPGILSHARKRRREGEFAQEIKKCAFLCYNSR